MIHKTIQNAARKKGSQRLPVASRILGNVEWIFALIVFGVIGFVIIEGWTVGDSLYMTIITMSTVGYGETNELTLVGRMFASILILLSILGMTFWTAQITTTFVSGELSGRFSAKRVRKMIETLENHAIVFGSGTMATTILNRLQTAGRDCVIIDDNPESLKLIRSMGQNVLAIEADPKSEIALSDANIFSASHVVATLDSDFDNLLISMTVKELDPDKIVIARADDPRVASRMIKIGVDQVVSPFQLSGIHVADIVSGETEPAPPLMP